MRRSDLLTILMMLLGGGLAGCAMVGVPLLLISPSGGDNAGLRVEEVVARGVSSKRAGELRCVPPTELREGIYQAVTQKGGVLCLAPVLIAPTPTPTPTPSPTCTPTPTPSATPTPTPTFTPTPSPTLERFNPLALTSFAAPVINLSNSVGGASTASSPPRRGVLQLVGAELEARSHRLFLRFEAEDTGALPFIRLVKVKPNRAPDSEGAFRVQLENCPATHGEIEPVSLRSQGTQPRHYVAEFDVDRMNEYLVQLAPNEGSGVKKCYRVILPFFFPTPRPTPNANSGPPASPTTASKASFLRTENTVEDRHVEARAKGLRREEELPSQGGRS